MTYSIIGVLASIILLIINRDVLWGRNSKDSTRTQRNYRFFLMGVLCYYITDMLWGILEEHHLTAALYVDTVVYFLAMAVTCFFTVASAQISLSAICLLDIPRQIRPVI